jgi:hypothetical protein
VAIFRLQANPYTAPQFKLIALNGKDSWPIGNRPDRSGPIANGKSALFPVPYSLFPSSPPQSATPHNADQALLGVYDALHGALKANASLAGGSTNPTPHNADQVLLATFDSTNGALRINCVVGCAGNFQVNGAGLTSSSTINFQSSSAANGLTLTFSNPSAGNIQLGLSGTLGDAGLSNAYSGVGACAANTWATALSRNAAPTCTQPAISNLTATISSPLLLNSNTLSIQQANGSESGYLLSGDWTTFNGKQVALTFNSPLQNSSNTISCPNCEVTTNKNASNGYAGLSGGLLSASQLPAPTASSLGGVESLAHTGHQWINSISTSGVPAASQPGVADLSDAPSRGQVLAGPSAYGASAATGAYRALVPQDIPSGLLSCAVLDNAICTSHTDVAGNPDFLAAGSGVVIDVNGGTTPLTYFVGGVYQQINSQLTVTAATPGSDTAYFVTIKQDTANANPVSGDLVATNIPPAYQYTAPTCSALATSTNPHYWFNLASNTWESCTSNAGAFSVASPPVLPLGVAVVSSSPAVIADQAEPYRLNPYRRFELFGAGAEGVLKVTGTSTVDGYHEYSFVLVDGNSAVLQHTALSSNYTSVRGLMFKSQNGILFINDGVGNVNALGVPCGASGTTGAGGGARNAQNGAGLAGTGGGGGGSGASGNNAGGAGGSGINPFGSNSAGAQGGGAGGGTSTAGGAGANANAVASTGGIKDFTQLAGGFGASSATGGGDGTNAGGACNSGGGLIAMSAPWIGVYSGSSVTANGGAGGNGAGGNAGGGGGAGGVRWFLVDTSRTVRVGRTHQPRAAVPTVLGLERAAMAARAAMGRRWPLNSGEKDEPPRHEGTNK